MDCNRDMIVKSLEHTCILTLMIGLPLFVADPAWALHLGGTTGHGGAYTTVKAEDVRNTLHNLSLSNPVAGVNISSGANTTTEVCVFCHTPHGGSVAVSAAPLWNRAVPASSGYTPYSGPNMEVNPGQPEGVSLACLSCHDGVAALDAFVNAPGSGGFLGLTNIVTGNFIAGASSFLESDNSMSASPRGAEANYEPLSGGTPFPNLTKDLSDDHPISFEIPTSTDPQFAGLSIGQVGNVGIISGNGLVAPSDTRDSLRTYPSAGGAIWVNPGWIECASCHNPHTPRPLFLRLPNAPIAFGPLPSGGGMTTVDDVIGSSGISTLIADDPNAGSALCVSCHDK